MRYNEIFVVGLDKDGYEMFSNECCTIREAKDDARWRVKNDDEFIATGLHKTEVRVDGECLYNYFVQ